MVRIRLNDWISTTPRLKLVFSSTMVLSHVIGVPQLHTLSHKNIHTGIICTPIYMPMYANNDLP